MSGNLICSPGLLASTLALSETGDAEVMARLVVYSELLNRWSKVQRLVGWRKASLFASEGLADAWTLCPVLDARPRDWVLDLGSGAGLPGLVLAIARPTREVHLVEPRRKRVSFLREVRRELKLDKVTVHHGREEDIRADFKDRGGALLFARAFRPPEGILACASSWRASACVLSLGSDREVDIDGWESFDEIEGRPLGRKVHRVLVPSVES